MAIHDIEVDQNSSSLNIVFDSNPSFGVNKAILAKVVQEKDLQILQNHGGVGLLSSSLETNVESGISGDNIDIARRRSTFGSNTYSNPPSRAFIRFFVESFKDFTILILLTCAALSLCFGSIQHDLKEGCYDGASIFVVVFFVIVVSSLANFMHDKVADEFSLASNSLQINVVRNRKLLKISTLEIVVGDVVLLKMGDHVPADGLFLDGNSLQVDESNVTAGESSYHVSINKHHPFLFSGAKVVDGYVKMLVTCVGMNTTRGQIMSSTSHKGHNTNNEQTPLQERLNEFASFVGKFGLAMAVLVVVIDLIGYLAGNTKDKNGNREFDGRKTKLDDMENAVVQILADAVTIVVVTTPVGLQLAVKLTLAYSMKTMMAYHQAMVRKLSSCETIGSSTAICTDKTGTLTVNQMKVTKFCVGLAERAYSRSVASCVVGLIREGIALNTIGAVFRGLNSDSVLEISGSPTEKAILSWAILDLNMEMELITQKCHILHVEAFNSKYKRSGVMIRRKADNTIHVHWKGAAEMIFKLCSSYFDASGIVKNLDDDDAGSKIEHIIQAMAATGLRCIAFATKQVTEEELHRDKEKGSKTIREDGLTLLAIVGIKNPCHVGVKTAVEACQKAGADVKMITGDNIFTAKAIASECGILGTDDQDTSNESVVEAEEFRNYTPEERWKKMDQIRVMAGSSPSDKLLMIRCLKQKYHHVISVMTGNDIGDASALKEANLGISIGGNATKEAKESSDIFIGTDNGFPAVVMVLMLSRLVQENIHKLIVVQLTTNVVACVLNSMIMLVAKRAVPITALDYFGASLIIFVAYFLSLAVHVHEKPVDELIENPPAGRINHNEIWNQVLTRAFYLIAALFILQHGFGKSNLFSEDSKGNTVTFIFNIFVLHQVYNEFHAEQKLNSVFSPSG